jgi:NAD(P)-dependent dehydrogenase (short-subunit alcohol dehydrogenase family)
VTGPKPLFEGKRVVLVGCAANIGRATALAFAQHGARLFLVDINDGAIETADMAKEHGVGAEFHRADMTDAAEAQAMFDAAAGRMGGVDVILNNAGIQRAAPVTELATDVWDATMRVNAGSCFLSAKYGVPHLESAGGGVIVNMASLAGVHGVPGLTAYCASKGAIVAFTRALAVEVAAKGIRANVLCPGFIDTSFNAPVIAYMGGDQKVAENIRRDVPLGRQGRPEEIASAFLFLASDMSSYMTGQALTVDGGILI